MLSYEIINKNLKKLEESIKIFPDILGKYQKLTKSIILNGELSRLNDSLISERIKISSLASKIGLDQYINFIDWVAKSGDQKIIYTHEIPFDSLKSRLIDGCEDEEVKSFLSKKTKKGFESFLNSRQYHVYCGDYWTGRRGNRKRFKKNFIKNELLIINYAIQNELILKDHDNLTHFYKNELPNFESEINTELDITNDIIKSLFKKIKSIKYDFRKLNFNLLKSEIENKIRNKMLSVEEGEKIKCIEEQPGLTLYKVYNVYSYEIGINGNLLVKVTNDNNQSKKYNYRLFESVSKLRETNIDNILNILYE